MLGVMNRGELFGWTALPVFIARVLCRDFLSIAGADECSHRNEYRVGFFGIVYSSLECLSVFDFAGCTACIFGEDFFG